MSPLRFYHIVPTLVCVFCSIVSAEDIGIPKLDRKDSEAINLLENRLTAWVAEDSRPIENWIYRNGVLTNVKQGSHIISKQKFRDFDLSLEFNLPRKGNSGVYLRGRYEVQLYDHKNYPLIKSTGSIWGQIPIESRMYKGANSWNTLDVRLKGNTVTVLVNRKPVIRSQPLKGPSRGAIDENESAPGPILLQSLRGVRFRNIYIKKL